MSELEPDPVLVDVTATCHTAGCASDGAAVPLTVPDDVGAYFCGACGQPIDDVVPAP
jgi:hypothetical protein